MLGLPGMGEQLLEMPVRLGLPGGAGVWVEPFSGRQHAAAIGLALYGARQLEDGARRRLPLALQTSGFGKVGGRVRAWLTEMF